MPALPPTPLVLGDNNIWPFRLAEGGWLLVDAGIDTSFGTGEDCVTAWEVLLEQARAIGCAPGDVRAVVVTHEHIDHAGLAARWAAEGARIVAMPEALPMLAAGHAAYDAIRARRIEEMRSHGCPPDVLDAIVTALTAWTRGGRHAGRSLRWEACPTEAFEAAQDGDTFALDGALANERTLHLIAAPGHTPGNLVVFVADEDGAGDLCSGDTLLPTTVPTPGLQFPVIATNLAAAPRLATARDARATREAEPEAAHGEVGRWPSLPPFLRSVQALRALDVRRILPGHGAVVDDPQRLFTQFAEHHARRSRLVRAHLERASDTTGGVTAYEIVRGLFPRLPAARIGQALTEVIGHLDVLEERGEAAPEVWAHGPADRIVRYRLTR